MTKKWRATRPPSILIFLQIFYINAYVFEDDLVPHCPQGKGCMKWTLPFAQWTLPIQTRIVFVIGNFTDIFRVDFFLVVVALGKGYLRGFPLRNLSWGWEIPWRGRWIFRCYLKNNKKLNKIKFFSLKVSCNIKNKTNINYYVYGEGSSPPQYLALYASYF